jgi:flagellar hook-associated protein 1
MNLDSALSIATGGLANVNRQMGVVSQNVANASTPGYAAEISTQQSMTANGEGLGVRGGPAIRNLDTVLQAELFTQNASVAGLQTRQTALQAIDAVQGTPGQGGDIASLLGQLQDQFSTLLNNPDSPPQQSAVVSAAATLAQGIHSLSDAYTTQRQQAEDNIVSGIATLNTTLGTIGALSDKIVTLKASRLSVADLENQRDAAVADLSQQLDVKAMEQPNGDLLIATTAGLILPIHGTTNPLTATGTNVQPNTFYPGGGIPGVTLGGADITSQLRGGQIGANITLRDVTLPTDQAELDEFAQNLASRFDAQGLTLFTDPTGGPVPAPNAPPTPVQTNYINFASIIQVNPTVQAKPSLVRDGTAPLPPPPMPVGGNIGIITAVLNNTFGSVPAMTTSVTQLGPNGDLTARYTTPATLGQFVATMLAANAQDSATTSTQADNEQAVQTTLAGKLSTQSGVNMDTEMSHMIQLQNAYGANARIISTIQAMWSQLLQSVT